MSTTFDIGCTACRKKLWIGQSTHIYSGPAYLERLSAFLLQHKGHALLVADEQMVELDEFADAWDSDAEIDQRLVAPQNDTQA